MKKRSYIKSDKNIQLWLKGLRLVLMESQGSDIDICFRHSTKALFANGRMDPNKLVIDTPHNWLISVLVVIRDIHGNYDGIAEHEIFMGTKINDTAEKVMPLLESIKDGLNEKMIVE